MSSLVPSVVVTSAWVSPRVKIARTVGAGQNADFDPDIANLVEGAAIGTALLFDHLLAEDALAQRLVIGVRASCWAASSSSGIAASTPS